jgi:hypothetical protein
MTYRQLRRVLKTLKNARQEYTMMKVGFRQAFSTRMGRTNGVMTSNSNCHFFQRVMSATAAVCAFAVLRTLVDHVLFSAWSG